MPAAATVPSNDPFRLGLTILEIGAGRGRTSGLAPRSPDTPLGQHHCAGGVKARLRRAIGGEADCPRFGRDRVESRVRRETGKE